MVSLSVYLILLLVPVPLFAFIVAKIAGSVGSKRSGFGNGLMAVSVLLIVNAAIGTVFVLLPVERLLVFLSLVALLLVVQILATFLVLQNVFRLPVGRAFAPFFAYLALSTWLGGIVFEFVNPYVVESFVQTNRSMAPTIQPGDRFTVDKLSAPQRWDIIAYSTDEEPPVILLHRLVGLPGERLRFEGGKLYINDHVVPGPEVMGGYHAAPSGVDESIVLYHDGEDITLSDDEYFFVGDNVDRSLDSRLNGPSSDSSLMGVADLRFWPFDRIEFLRQ